MATCLRSVPNKICTSYMKPTSCVIYVDNNGSYPTVSTRSRKTLKEVDVRSPSVISSEFWCDHGTLCNSATYSGKPRNILSIQNNRDLLSNIDKCSGVKSQSTPELKGRPSPEQLEDVAKSLTHHLTNFFKQTSYQPFYHKDIVLENNMRGTKHIGIASYVSQLTLLKMLCSFKFAYTKSDILKITKHPEDGTIKVRWTIRGIAATTVLFQFYKLKVTRMKDEMLNAPIYMDGFSIFYVDSDGLIVKHVVDRMQPDDDRVAVAKPVVTSKLAMFLGLEKKYQRSLVLNTVQHFRKVMTNQEFPK